MAPLTVRQRRSTVRRWIEPRLGVVDLRDIRQEHLDRFAASLPSKGAGVAGVAEGTRRAIVSVLMTALRQAERWGRIEKAPSMPRLPAAVPRWRWISVSAVVVERALCQSRSIYRKDSCGSRG